VVKIGEIRTFDRQLCRTEDVFRVLNEDSDITDELKSFVVGIFCVKGLINVRKL
jgi:hypothetical protein